MVPRHGADPVPVGFCCSQGAFPARLKKVFIVGAPMWFRLPYSIISLLLKEKLRERVSVSRGVTALPLPVFHPVCFEAVPKGDGVVWPLAPSCWVRFGDTQAPAARCCLPIPSPTPAPLPKSPAAPASAAMLPAAGGDRTAERERKCLLSPRDGKGS